MSAAATILSASNDAFTSETFSTTASAPEDDDDADAALLTSVSSTYNPSPTSITPSTSPNCLTNTPCCSALISTVTLSVSTNANTSPSLTTDPGETHHSTIVPSVMESPIVGTLTVICAWIYGVMDIDLIFCKTSFVIMFFDCICLDAAVDTLGNILDIMIMFLLPIAQRKLQSL